MNEAPRYNKVLIADDDPVTQIIFAHRLRRLGYRVQVAQDGREVLELLERHRYGIILLDIIMPGLNGIETCRKIFEGVTPDDRPIIIGFSSSAANEEKALQSGMVAFFEKDYMVKNLDDILQATLTAML